MRSKAILTAVIFAVAMAATVAGCKSSSDDALPDKPQLQPDKTALTFGGAAGQAVWAGTKVNETLQLKNGGKQDLHISNVALSGTDANLFTLQTDKSAVTSRSAAFVMVSYAPTAAGEHKAELQITSDAENTPQLIVPITATAVAAQQ